LVETLKIRGSRRSKKGMASIRINLREDKEKGKKKSGEDDPKIYLKKKKKKKDETLLW
jgi:hypothetical protein